MSDQVEPSARAENSVSGEAGIVVQSGVISGGVHLYSTDRHVPLDPPRELPSEVFGFTDRTDQLAELDALLSAVEHERSAAVVITAITGTAGVGKTAFATHWAHRVRDRFPDGQLYVNLRGYDPEQSVAANEALARFLHRLGVRNEEIPYELDDRAARFRSLTAGKRMLIVLDNARTVEQVRPLLPGTSSSIVLVTSRDSLPGLVSRDGARRINLDLLPPAKAIELLRTLVGERIDAEPDSAIALIEQCARLPLALRIAAELAAASPETTLGDLVADLDDEHTRLDLLDAGEDPYTAVRAVLSWSYQYLNPRVGRLLRLLGLVPGRTFDVYAAAALVDEQVTEARRMLGILVRANLVESVRSGAYQMHDLLRMYAADLAREEDSGEQRYAALGRLLDYYLHSAADAIRLTLPQEQSSMPRLPVAPELIAVHRDPDSAAAWLDMERVNLLACAAYAVANDRTGYANNFSAVLDRYVDSRSHFDEAITLHTHAVDASACEGDNLSEGYARYRQSVVYQRIGRYHEAMESMKSSIELIADRDPKHAAYAIKSVGFLHGLQGDHSAALRHATHALELFRQQADEFGEGRTLNDLGLVYTRLDRLDEAVACLNQALDIYRRANDRVRQGYAVNDLGGVHRRLGSYDTAAAHHRQALDLAKLNSDRSLEAAALNGIGYVTRMTNAPLHVLPLHQEALSIAESIGDRYEQAQAHEGLAGAHLDLDYRDEARVHWRSALVVYNELGVPDSHRVAQLLDDLDAGDRA